MQSLLRPQADELIDFALAQLITDTNDISSVIRGHSMARDMFGNDAITNGYLTFSSTTGLPFSITGVAATGLTTLTGATYNLTTNIKTNDPAFSGFFFNRWIMRVSYTGAINLQSGTLNGTGVVNQTFEVLADSGFNAAPPPANQFRTLTVNITATDAGLSSILNGEATALVNPTAGLLVNPTGAPVVTQLPGQYIFNAATNNVALGANTFTLDGRWLHAFNGAGQGALASSITGVSNSYYPNFRYNGLLNPPPTAATPAYGPGTVGMDEDYDACDLENWFLAIQSADGNVMIPSFHRPGIIRVDQNNLVNDWLRQNNSNPGGGQLWADSAARFLRPCQADGHDAATFPDLYPNPATGQMPYDVDNDGDGITDSVWLDLGYPARRDSSGRLFKPLFAFMVIGLNGRIPLNTAGNLAAQVGGVFVPPNIGAPAPDPLPPTYYGGAAHAVHLGNSISEVDPTYALQNAFDGSAQDNQLAFAPPAPALGTPAPPALYPNNVNFANNTQVDTSGVDVRLTQLRNLLAGTRPQNNPTTYNTANNADTDYVLYNTGLAAQQPYYMPNGSAAPVGFNIDFSTADPNTGLPYLARSTQPVPGRWGEAQSIPGTPFANPLLATNPALPAIVNVVGSNYTDPVRAGYSLNLRDILLGLPPDAADDNFNTYDPFPIGHAGEVGDADLYDAAGALVLPVERMRRWLTPADINGTGSVLAWSAGERTINRGTDLVGRVEYNSYFRPPGSPGVISTNYTVTAGVPTSTDGTTLGAIYFPTANPPNPDPFYNSGPANNIPNISNVPLIAAPLVYPAYLPDMTNNPTHGYESFRFPNQAYWNPTAVPPAFRFFPQQIGGAPLDQNQDLTPIAAPPPYPTGVPNAFPTYDVVVNATVHSDGLNDADEMNLYAPNPLQDSPYGPGDIEWLYRQQDVDGTSLSSRLSQLAPVSFTNGLDGARRRKLFALDSFDLNNFVWANDNPAGQFPTNSWFASPTPAVPNPTLPDPSTGGTTRINVANASFAALSAINTANAGANVINATPTLAQRDKKINLNYPLPVSNDPNEPIRQKWISDTYQLLKWVLPPKAVDTPEELAQLSQYVINIIDFRDPDGTMTHWVNPDVVIAGVPVAPLAMGGAVAVPTTSIYLVFANAVPAPVNPVALDQWGMEYNPAALNEVLAYSFLYTTTAAPAGGFGTRWSRFFAELVNTQTSPELANTAAGTPSPFNPVLDLGGYEYTAGDPYAGGSWDIVFTADDPYSRPDPYRGQLVPYANLYAATPLSQYSFKPPLAPSTFNNPAPTGTLTDGFDVMLQPMGQGTSVTVPIPFPAPFPPPAPIGTILPGGAASPLPIDYFYVFGNSPPTGVPGGAAAGAAATYEIGSPGPTTLYPVTNTIYYDVPANTPSQIQSLKDATSLINMDPMNGAPSTSSPIPLYEGSLPGIILQPSALDPNPNTITPLPSNYATKLPAIGAPAAPTVPPAPPATNAALYYWVCLRRPANLFAPVSAANPMVVVDAVRFPYFDGTGPLTTAGPPGGPANIPTWAAANFCYSAQRYQPYRGGHAVPAPQPAGGAAAVAGTPIQVAIDPRYGYTEQIVVPTINTLLNTQGVYYIDNNGVQYPATQRIYHTLGWANEYEQGSGNPEAEPWDFFPFNDRDFTSVAELMLVPGCPPGLFTKQFVEFAPSYANIANVFSAVQPRAAALASAPPAPAPGPPATAYTPPLGGPPPPPAPPVPPGPPPVALQNVSLNGVAPGSLTGVLTPPVLPPPTNFVQAFATASAPLTWFSGYVPGALAYTGISVPVQPHTFPYLNDQFFYSGYGGAATIDPGLQVGGYSADGWFKMFEFFEVPSQALGAIGTVASGTNFDWMRQDIKPGQLNLNMIIDEEVFFSLTGQQHISQSNGQNSDAAGPIGDQTPGDQFSQQLLNFNQIQGLAAGLYTGPISTPALPTFLWPLGTSPTPMVVTSILASGTPGTSYPVPSYPFGSTGVLALDPISNYLYNLNGNPPAPPVPPYYNALKASWVQFLTLRHGGSGYLFGFGTGSVGQNYAVAPNNPPLALPAVNNLYGTGLPADRPFHSLSYPDIDFTVMRPAALPPSLYTNPVINNAATTFDVAAVPPTADYYAGDPGVRNPTIYFPYPSANLTVLGIPPNYPGTLPTGSLTGNAVTPSALGYAAYNTVLPPAIPARRLFQPPDAYNPNPGQFPQPNIAPNLTTSIIATASNASETGDPYINNQIPIIPAAAVLPVFLTAPGALPPFAINPPAAAPLPPPYYPAPAGTTYSAIVNNSVVNLYWPAGATANLGAGFAADLVVTSALGTVPTGIPSPAGGSSPYLGSNSNTTAVPGTPSPDFRQHPYWRSEQLQRVMNLTTVRTHQYAVWLTIGFFEVVRQGDLVMFAFNPQAAFDVLGPEIGAANGNNVRYRGFYLVDRLKLTGFNPSSTSAFRTALVYRQRIQ
jgi:hypothetical protein